MCGNRGSDVDGPVLDEVLRVGVPEGEDRRELEPVLQVRQPATDSIHVVALPGGTDRLLLSVVGHVNIRTKVVHAGGGVIFLIGAAKNMLMLILGRILLGVGVGFANQLMITIGILCANLINYGMVKIKGGWGWHISLALAAIPGAIIAVRSLFLHDTPNYLIERGHTDQAKRMLCRIRGTDDILDEFNDLVAASEESKLVKHL